MASHEQRIADLEREVAELKRIVGAPGGALGGIGVHPLSNIGAPRHTHGQADAYVSGVQPQGAEAYRKAVDGQMKAEHQKWSAAMQQALSAQGVENLGQAAQLNLCQAQNLNQCTADTPYADATVAPR